MKTQVVYPKTKASKPVQPKAPSNQALVKAPSNNTLMRAAVSSVEAAFKALGVIITQGNPTSAVLAECYHVVNDQWLTYMEDVRKSLKGILIDRMKTEGKDSLEVAKGNDKWRVKFIEPKSKLPVVKLLLDLLEEKALKPEDACDTEITWIPSMDKIERLLADGRLTEEELGGTFKSMGERLTIEKL